MTLVTLGIVLMSESIASMMLMPFVGNLLAFITGGTVEESGYRSGTLVAVFFLGQTITSGVWGRWSDKYGRVPILISGQALNVVAIMVFGLSRSYAVCLLGRMLMGMCNGNIATGKAVMAEVSDSTNRGRAFTTLSLAWAFGSTLGMTVGGWLYDPMTHYPNMMNSIFGDGSLLCTLMRECPQLLPSLFSAVYCVCSGILIRVVLPETNLKAKPLPQGLRFWCSAGRRADAAANVVPEGGPESPPVQAEDEESVPLTFTKVWTELPSMRFIFITYMLLAATDICFWEVYPLWAVAPQRDGGLQLSVAEVGSDTMVQGLIVLAANAMFPFMLNRFGAERLLFMTNTWLALVFPFLPTLGYVARAFSPAPETTGSSSLIDPPVEASSVLRATLWLWIFLRGMANSWAFSTTFLLISEYAEPGQLAMANSLSQQHAGVVRLIVPPAVTALFAWSATQRFAGHVYVVWVTSACIAGVVPLLILQRWRTLATVGSATAAGGAAAPVPVNPFRALASTPRRTDPVGPVFVSVGVDDDFDDAELTSMLQTDVRPLPPQTSAHVPSATAASFSEAAPSDETSEGVAITSGSAAQSQLPTRGVVAQSANVASLGGTE
jgi:MFS family permease